jgi:hypothetical protein
MRLSKTAAWVAGSIGLVLVLALAVMAGFMVRGQHTAAAPAADQVTHSAPASPHKAKAHHKAHHHQNTKIVVVPANPAPANPAPATNPYASGRACLGDYVSHADGNYYAGPNTSCEFASNVVDAYPGYYPSTAMVYSPVTGQSYLMTYNLQGNYILATGGNGASVSF